MMGVLIFCLQRDINAAFAVVKINEQEENSNLLYLLYHLTICHWIYYQKIMQTCLVLIKWFNIATFKLFLS